ncbi:MAG: hypothetical protein GY778_30090 [bacterium]|nr:hypothetical protein [bacterium]
MSGEAFIVILDATVTVATATPGVLVAVLVATRRKPRPGRCDQCGYDLTGNVSGRCPECGVSL